VLLFGSYSRTQWEVRLWTAGGQVMFELREYGNKVTVRTMKGGWNCLNFGMLKPSSVDLSLRLISNDRIEVFISVVVYN
jgi:hypothetical protein